MIQSDDAKLNKFEATTDDAKPRKTKNKNPGEVKRKTKIPLKR